MTNELNYAAAGVDTEAGDLAVELMKGAIQATHGPQVLGGVGGFAGLYDAAALTSYRHPLLATSTDGVGTKVAIAQAMDVHDTIGIDLVGMVVDDIVVVGAKPLFMTDYIACGRVVPQRIADIVSGIAEGCRLAQTALVGGETAEHPGLLGPEEYDVAGAATGVVEADGLLGPQRVQAGDVLIGIASSGLHSNGYSLVREIVRRAGWQWDREVAEFGRTLGEEVLEPTRIYAAACLAAAANPLAQVHAYTHVTGGGLAANLARVLPAGLLATVERSSWQVPAVFQVLSGLGKVALGDQEQTWNLGVGMVGIVAPDGVDHMIAEFERAGMRAWRMGQVQELTEADLHDPTVVSGTKGVTAGAVRLVGNYQGS